MNVYLTRDQNDSSKRNDMSPKTAHELRCRLRERGGSMEHVISRGFGINTSCRD